MSSVGRLIFVLLIIMPMVVLQGKPELTPEWFFDNIAGVPVVAWLAALWFAVLIGASWLPVSSKEDRS
jgi:hypothetical protein